MEEDVKGAIAQVPRTHSVSCNYLNSTCYFSNEEVGILISMPSM